MANEPIEILIRKGDGSGGDTSKIDKTPTSTNKKKPVTDDGKSKTAQLVLTRAIALGQEALMSVMDKHSDWTGDSVMANRIKRTMSIGGSALAIYAGGWIGLGYVAGKEIIGAYTNFVDMEIEKRKIIYNNMRVGRVVNK